MEIEKVEQSEGLSRNLRDSEKKRPVYCHYTALEESRVTHLKARIEYTINLVRMNISVGQPVQ